ncbi:MAG: hypothetical protein MJA30_36170, partial [Cytophagales bacterium]|nr:hypothetical protein [Cytophagales bacterium]
MLGSTHRFDVNGVETQPVTRDLFLSRASTGYSLAVLGRSGESLQDRSIRVSLFHRDFSKPVIVNLKSDPEGKAGLGDLEGIERIEASLEGRPARQWSLVQAKAQLPSLIQLSSDETMEIPIGSFETEVGRNDLALFE